MLKEFRDFAMRGNVIDLAVGVIIGAAFGAIVSSLVADIIMPPIGVVLGGVDFSDFFINLSGQHFDTLADAKKASAATINHSTVPFPPSGSNPNKPSIQSGQNAVRIVAAPRMTERTISIRALSTAEPLSDCQVADLSKSDSRTSTCSTWA